MSFTKENKLMSNKFKLVRWADTKYIQTKKRGVSKKFFNFVFLTFELYTPLW